jgi:hypothetical protein
MAVKVKKVTTNKKSTSTKRSKPTVKSYTITENTEAEILILNDAGVHSGAAKNNSGRFISYPVGSTTIYKTVTDTVTVQPTIKEKIPLKYPKKNPFLDAIVTAGMEASALAMKTMGHTIEAKDGWLVKKNKKGVYTKIKKI